MAELSKDLVGRKLESYSFLIERGKVREFCLAIGETNPVYLDPEAARAAGFDDTPIPPTFQTAFQFWGYAGLWQDMQAVGIDTSRLLHMKEDYVYLQPLYPGNTITAQPEILAVKAGKNSVVTFGSVFSNEKGTACLESRMSIIIPAAEEQA